MILYITFLLYILGGASASVETIVTEIKVIEEMNLVCLQFTLKGIPLKEDFFSSSYSLDLEYYYDLKSPKTTMHMMSGDGTCNAMVTYNATMNSHITHVCGSLTRPFIEYYGIHAFSLGTVTLFHV